MSSLDISLADGVLVDAILIPPRSPISPTNLKRNEKITELITKKKPFTGRRRCKDG